MTVKVLAVSLSALSALFYTSHTVLVRKGITGSNPVSAVVAVLFVSTVIIWPTALLLEDVKNMSIEALLLFVASGVMVPGISRVLLYVGVSLVGVSVSTTVQSSSPLFAALFAILIIGEDMTVGTGLGTLSIVAGMVILSYGKGEKMVRLKGILAVLIGSAAWGLGAIFRKMALNISNLPMAGAAVTSSTALTLLVIFLFLSGIRFRIERNSYPALIGSGALVAGSVLTLFSAFSFGDVVVVAPLIAIQPLIALILTHLFLKKMELISFRVINGAVLAVIGTLLIVS